MKIGRLFQVHNHYNFGVLSLVGILKQLAQIPGTFSIGHLIIRRKDEITKGREVAAFDFLDRTGTSLAKSLFQDHVSFLLPGLVQQTFFVVF